jgi:type II secretory pathway pseudopilin PulG
MKNACSQKSSTGFTLIETLIYIALFGMLIGGAFTGVYTVIESTGRTQTRIMMQQEGNFLLAKIQRALSGAQAIDQPVLGSSGSILSLARIMDFDENDQPITSSIIISLSGAGIELSYPNKPAPNTFALNNSNSVISNLAFDHTVISGNGLQPEKLILRFTLSARTSSGVMLSQDFSETTYLKK